MKLQKGTTVVDYYPLKSFISHQIEEGYFVKVVTENGKTAERQVWDKNSKNEQVDEYMKKSFEVVGNNDLPQYANPNQTGEQIS
tara:strand:+ start:378 stop:629 length:252 start_codon:yes stop_codon:yes gene_type:complete